MNIEDFFPSEDDKVVINEGKFKYEIMAVENNMIALVKLSIEEEQTSEETSTDEE